jgi:hypothetical protein
MKTARITLLALACSLAAHADFSYTQTRKSTGGMAAGAMQGMNPTMKHYMKGQKMKVDMGNTATIMDFDAQTVTSVNNTDKTYTVTKFSDIGQTLKDSGADVQVDVKETGQRKTINGFNCSQVLMTMSMQGTASKQAPPGVNMQIEMEMWVSGDVPGAAEARAFYQKNGDKLPYATMAAGNPQMQKSMAAMQRKLASLGGVSVMQIVRTKMGGPGADAQAQKMQEAMAQMEAMKKAGGAQAQAAEQMMARMGGMRGGAGGSLFEMTMESSDFSTASIPDSVFAVPAGYTKK